MNFSQIKAFILLANGDSVTEASKKLFCTQPSVSTKIKNLEEELNTILFERINNRLYLTPQGKEYLKYATEIIDLVHLSSEKMRLFNDPLHGEVRFGTNHFAGVYFLPKIMSTFLKNVPLAKLNMEISTSKLLINSLDEQRLDFLVVSDYLKLDKSKYIFQKIANDPFVLICSPNHWLAGYTKCLFSDIKNELFLMKAEHSATRKFIMKEIMEHNFCLNNIMEINNLESIKKSVIYNIGISIVPKLSIRDEVKAKLLCEVEIEDMSFIRNINYIYSKDKALSPVTKNFLSFIKDSYY